MTRGRPILLVVAVAAFAARATFAASTAQPPTQPRAGDVVVATVVVGDDAAVAGSVQQRIEQRLATVPDLHRHPIEKVAASLASPEPTGLAPPDKAATESAALLTRAVDAYYDDRQDEALAALSELETLQSGMPEVPAADRIRLALLRATIFLARGNAPLAIAKAKEALVLNPTLSIDVAEYPPDLRDLVDQIRDSVVSQSIQISVLDLPAGAEVRVDGRVVEPRFRLPPGRHALKVTAPNFRTVTLSFESTRDLELKAPMALHLGDARVAELRGLVRGELAAAAEKAKLEALRATLGVDAVVVVDAAGSDAAYASALRDGAVERSGRVTDAELVSWVESTARAWTRRKDYLPHWRVTADAGPATSARLRSVQGDGGKALKTALAGIGSRAAVGLDHRWFSARLEVTALSFGITSIEVVEPDGGSGTVGGGSAVTTRIALGYRKTIPTRGPIAPSWAVLVGMQFEKYSADDLRDSVGDLGLVPSYNSGGIQLRGETHVPVGSVGGAPLILGLEACVGQQHVTETPEGTSGEFENGSTAALGGSLETTVRGKWRLKAEYGAALWKLFFTGAPSAPTTDPVVDVVQTQFRHLVIVSVGRSF